MEPSESREPSYYEVALTNRQVLVAFVALLTCMVAAFFSGVWIGRGGAGEPQPSALEARSAPPPDPQLDQLSFFSGREAGSRGTPTPALRPTQTPRPTRAPAAIEVPAPTASAARTPTPTPGPAPTRAATSAPTAVAAEPQATVFVQVYSSSNGARAREIAAELRKAGFKVLLVEAPTAGSITYRVRVGPFASRGQAEEAAQKLRRQHRLDTWVTETP